MNQESEQHNQSRLAHFPVSFFSTIMGLSGLTIAWQKAHAALGASSLVWQSIAGLTAVLFVFLALVYGLKLIRHFPEVTAEWKHPVRVNFFPTVSIGLLLQSVVWLEAAPAAAYALWLVGALVHFLFTLTILSSWMFHTHYDIKHANPGWFIPVVGNLFVPIGAAHFGQTEVGWFFFAVGIVFWVVMMTIVFYRVLFHDPIPPRLLPTLFILIAPPAVGFLAWTNLVGGLDPFGRLLVFSADFFFVLLLPQVATLARLPFTLSWWAYSFPLAALTIAQFTLAELTGTAVYRLAGYGLFTLLAVLIAGLAGRTLLGLARREFCVPEH